MKVMTKRTKELATVDLHGKQYTLVSTRLKYVAETFVFELDSNAEFIESLNSWKVKSVLKIHEKDASGNNIILSYSGNACEMIGSSDINHLSALENAETSAVGRACGFAGIGLTESIASAEEVQAGKESVKEAKVQKRASQTKTAEEKTLEKLTGNKPK